MVEQAGIPKGTLFFYFGNKRGLFLYLVDYCIERYIQYFETHRIDLPSDLFERLFYIGGIKIRFALSEPLVYKMFYHAFLTLPEELREDLADRTRQYASASSQILLGDLDLSKFRPGISTTRVIEMIAFIQEGVLQKYQASIRGQSPEESLKTIDHITGEFHDYFDWLKFGVYQPTA
jgi:AcrR family transcriptional regulator